jgi:hypothetical protein
MAELVDDDVETYTGAIIAVLNATGKKLDPEKPSGASILSIGMIGLNLSRGLERT